MWNGVDSDAESGSSTMPSELVAARTAWRTFWEMAIGFYQGLHRQGSNRFRAALASSQATSVFNTAVQELQRCLRRLASEHFNRGFAKLFMSIADLVDAHGTLSWVAISELWPRAKPALARAESRVSELPALPKKQLVHRRVWSMDGACSLHRLEPETHLLCKDTPCVTKEEEEPVCDQSKCHDLSPPKRFSHSRTKSGPHLQQLLPVESPAIQSSPPRVWR